MNTEESIVFNLELNVDSALSNSRKLEMIFFRALGLWTRICRLLGLPDDSPAVAVVQKVQQVTMVIRQLHTAAILMEAASGPVGWAMAGIGLGTAVIGAVEFTASLGE